MKGFNHSLYIKVLFTFLFWSTIGNVNSYGQDVNERKWFASIDGGIQMSGIKSEDFVSSNYSPLFRLSLGKEFSPNFGVQIGYQGKYFLLISDDLRYNYDFFFIEGMVNMTNLFFGKNLHRKYNLWFHAGPGYFYHEIYDRSDLHWNFGGSNTFFLSDKFSLKLDVSAVIGWDIYQGDMDILPSISAGVIIKEIF